MSNKVLLTTNILSKSDFLEKIKTFYIKYKKPYKL